MQTIRQAARVCATTLACLSLILVSRISSTSSHTIEGIKVAHGRAAILDNSDGQLKANSKSSTAVVRAVSNSQARQAIGSLVRRILGNNRTLVKQQQQPRQQQVLEEVQYGIVVDCGSSGTRATIYTWPVGVQTGELAYKIQALRDAKTNEPVSVRIRPGLASVRGNPNYASDYMRPIMEFASKNVPAAKQASTPVYIMGTGGMRLLTAQERQSIIDDLRQDLGREFGFRDIRADVISGVEEGVFQWVSVNSLADRLTAQFDLDNSANPLWFWRGRGRRRLGLIEMGGASAQIAFEVSPAMSELIRRRLKHQEAAWRLVSTSGLELNLYGDQEADVSVFSVSYLGFGSDSVRTLAVDLIVQNALARLRPFVARASGSVSIASLVLQANNTLTVDDPCLPVGSEETVAKPLELLSGQSPTIGYNLAADQQQVKQVKQVKQQQPEIFSVRLIGRGSYPHCQKLLNRLASVARQEQTSCNMQPKEEPCEAPLIGTNFMPWQELQWIGLGELYYTTHDMLDAAGQFNGPLVQFKTARLCSSSWRDIQAQYGTESEFERRRNLLACFKATWILTWLSTILRMPLGAGGGLVDFQTAKQVAGVDVDWKLGAIITKTINGS